MKLKKGPYGCFLTETIKLDEFSRYASEIVEKFVYYNTVTVNAYEANNSVELSYDISNLMTMSELIGMTKNQAIITRQIRKMTGSLLTIVIKGLDLLLSPDNWLIDINHVFYDKENDAFRFIYVPRTSGASSIYLQALEESDFESFLNQDLIKPYLSEDEINSILYFIRENDETSLINLALSLDSTKDKKTSDSNQDLDLLTSPYIKVTLLLIMFTIALYNYVMTSRFVGELLLLTTISAVFTLLPLDKIIGLIKDLISKKTATNINRTDILFGKEDINLDYNYATLTSILKVNGNFIRKSLISDIVTIGSDCFLSDIVIESSDISPLHASITIKDNEYILKDLSTNNTTYIENKKIIPDKEYEIKDGQILSFGNYDFEFKTRKTT